MLLKKVFLLIMTCLLLAGCGKSSSNENIIKNFQKSVEKSKSYTLKGKMELRSDEEIFNYTIDVAYLKDNYYKVKMVNTQNNHEQVILRNDEGLYVITPSLNKSFKFESSWPDNSSQGYILSSLVNDIKNDKDAKATDKDGYVINAKVNYPNNSDLKYQKIYLDKDYKVTKVEVYSEADLPKIIIELTEVDLKASVDKDIFDLKNYIKEDACEEESCEKKAMSSIENAIYPLYMPSNTFLSSSEVVNNEDDARVILTFSGDKNFVIVEQSSVLNDDHEVIPVYGEPLMLNDTIAALSSNSMYWTKNDIDYYLASNDLTVDEMIFVASSLGNAKSTLATK